MKIMVIHLNDVNMCPPVISLVENLVEQGQEVLLVSYNVDEMRSKKIMPDNFHKFDLGKYITPSNNIKKYILRLSTRKRVRKYVADHIDKYDRVWTTSEITVREVGAVLLKSKTKHIMQLMELTDYVPMFGGYKLFKFNIEKYAQAAYKVVVPEKNRAHIVKVKWHLKRLPEVLPNKPYTINVDETNLTSTAKEIVERIKGQHKKVILYQGGFTKDRKFDQFARAMEKVGQNYVLCMLGKDNQYRKQICEQYPFIQYLGFLQPPEHLVVAKYAHIGILTYFPIQDGFYSDLNAVFCAPNKTFEYALCRLPMIGTNVPGLGDIFEKFEIGCCIENDEEDAVIDAIKYVEAHYQSMKENCKKYFDSVDLISLVRGIIK